METVVAPQKIQIHNQSFNSTVPTIIQVVEENGKSAEDTLDLQKSKMAFSRRPTYQSDSHCTTHMTKSFNDKMCITILNELSSDAPTIPKIEVKTEVVPNFPLVPPSIVQTGSGQYIAISQDGAIQLASPRTDGMQGRQTVTLANSGMALPGAPILQYPGQSGDMAHHFFMPGSKMVLQAATGDMSAYQIRSPTSSLPQGVMMAVSPASLHSPQQLAEEATRKREVRLFKNREAARECRRKKKEYVKCLENRVAVLENQNRTLIEELKALKDIYCHKQNNHWLGGQ